MIDLLVVLLLVAAFAALGGLAWLCQLVRS
jgi:hypothetical protein